MRWFKHMTDAMDDELIMALEEEMGLVGYALYFKVLEIVGRNTKEGEPFLKISLKIFAKKINCSPKVFEKFLKISEKLSKNFHGKEPLFHFSLVDGELEIKVPKLLEINDKYSQAKARKTMKKGPQCVHSVPKMFPLEVEVEVKEKKYIKKEPDVPEKVPSELEQDSEKSQAELVEKIYQTFPRHEGKGAAIAEIEKALRRVDGEVLLANVREYAGGEYVRTAPKKYIPMPSTWFHQSRWLDDHAAWHRPYGDTSSTEDEEDTLAGEPDGPLYKRFTQARRMKRVMGG